MRTTLPSKYTSETVSALFDFTGQLAVGETISTAAATCAVFSGVDSSPSAVISGSATASGSQVTQLLTGGVTGVIYDITVTITTSLSQTLVTNAYLAVIPSTT